MTLSVHGKSPIHSRNPLLRALIRECPGHLVTVLEAIEVARGQTLFESDHRTPWVWIPETCVVSLRVSLPDGADVESALFGEEGFIGLWNSTDPGTGTGVVHLRAVVLKDGVAWRMPATALRGAIDSSAGVRAAFLAQQVSLGSEMLTRTICNRHHRIDRQLCRWLLTYRDRARSDDIGCTQQELAAILGVRREGVTEALGRLAAAGAVGLRRGGLRILDAAHLAANACACYRPVDGRFSATMMQPTMTKTADSHAALTRAPG